jgi:hypothetical protein
MMMTPIPRFSALYLTQKPSGLVFKFKYEPGQDIYLDGEPIGANVHGEFPLNLFPHLRSKTPKSAAARSSLRYTLKAALEELPEKYALRFRRYVMALMNQQAITNLSAKISPRTISGQINLIE